jgi:Leucine-rich repeat (LRR) protein
MPLALSVLFFFCIMQASSIICSSELNGLDTFKAAQPDSPLVQLPQLVIDRIIECIPLFYAHDSAQLRLTCRFFREAIVLSPKIRLGVVPYAKEQYELWKKLYDRIAIYIKIVADSKGVVSLDLSGNRVTEFMVGKYSVCQHIQKIKLVNCGITMERDNFFDKEVWINLEKINLSDNYLGLRDGDLNKSGDWYSGANIWPALCSLPKLKVLILKNNCLRRLPADIHKAKMLEVLDLRGNLLPKEDVDSLKSSLPKTKIIVDPKNPY